MSGSCYRKTPPSPILQAHHTSPMPPMEEIDDKEAPDFSPLRQQDADPLLAKEMADMSVQEREQSLDDIPGVSSTVLYEPKWKR
jgi:hypothetical protein